MGINEVAEAAEYNAIPGDIKWEDVNGDGLINFDDQKIIGNGQADYTMNIGNTFSYKNWDLSVDIRISQGNDIMDHSVILYVDRMGYGNTYKKFYDQSWTLIIKTQCILEFVKISKNSMALILVKFLMAAS